MDTETESGDGDTDGDGGSLLLSARIRNALTDEIASGQLAAGTALDEQLLANRFGASRTPVREALRQLAVSGLVEMRPRRPVLVARLTPDRIMDMFETAAEMEALCARLAATRMTPAELSEVVARHEDGVRAAAISDMDAYEEANHAFHAAIGDGTHNAFLAEQVQLLRARLKGFRRAQLRHLDRMQASAAEHRSIIAALTEGDGETAARRMRAHMINAAIALRRYLDHP